MKKVCKIIAIFAVLAIFAISLTGCGSAKETSSKSKDNDTVTIDYFIKKLEESDMIVTNKNEKSAQMIGAEEGYGLEINGAYIEIYSYDVNSKNDLTKSNIKSAKEKGIVTMPSFGDMELKARYNKGLVLVNYEEHPDSNEILKIFNNL